VKIPLMGLTMNVEKVLSYPLSSQGTVTVGMTAISFDTSGLHPMQSAEVAMSEGKTIDPTQVPVFAPPQNFEIKDPAKFYEKQRYNHRCGWIQLFLNKPYYLAGEIIAGRVDLNLTTPVQANAVKIKWTGWEKTYIENTVHWTDADGNSHTRVDVYKDDKTFFKADTLLVAINGGVMAPGMHSFAFQFQLPPGIPGIYFEKYKEFDGDKIKAAISYKVKVYVDMPGSDIKAKEMLVISESLSQRVMPVAQTKVKSFVFTKGKVQFTAEIGKDVFCPGEVIPLRVKVTNPTAKKVNAIKVKVYRELTVRAKGFKKKNTKEIQRWKFPGLEKKTDTDTVLQLQLPKEVYPSTNGQLVDCVYFLDMELDFPMAFDMNVTPKIVMALLPAPGEPMWLFNGYTPGWGAW